ncbi:MAG TPA: hypothetical protein VMS08_03275 [Candidatus Saccharimonadia bacterium]|nr:hypothetical protein [Candidatus Saccharimonadia bacterium]
MTKLDGNRGTVLLVTPSRVTGTIWRQAVPDGYTVIHVESLLTGRQHYDEQRASLTLIVVSDTLAGGAPADPLLSYIRANGYRQDLILEDSGVIGSVVALGRNYKVASGDATNLIRALLEIG